MGDGDGHHHWLIKCISINTVDSIGSFYLEYYVVYSSNNRFVHFAMCMFVQIIVGKAAQNGLDSEGER